MKKKFYFAYGMNTNPWEMYYRCPNSHAVGKAVLSGYEFEFRTHANIKTNDNTQVEGVLWEITKTDEDMLDLLEGFPTYYTKQMVTVKHNNIEFIAMTYIMNPTNQSGEPHQSYYALVSEGYTHFGINQKQLLDALPIKYEPIEYN